VKHLYDEDFEKWYAQYPRHVGKMDAFKAWKKALGSGVSVETLQMTLAQHKRLRQWVKDDWQFVPHPATWLNGRRWEDVLNPSELIPTPQEAKKIDRKAHQASLDRWREVYMRQEAERRERGDFGMEVPYDDKEAF
jgi:hypothetical protein